MVMPQPHLAQYQSQTKTPVLIFLKGMASPLVMYVENTDEFYKDMQEVIRNANEKSPKLIERTGNGPLKKIAVLDTQITGLAIQEETIVGY